MGVVAGILALHCDKADGALEVDRVRGLVANWQLRLCCPEVFEADVTHLAGLVAGVLSNFVSLISLCLFGYLEDMGVQRRSDSRFDARLLHCPRGAGVVT